MARGLVPGTLATRLARDNCSQELLCAPARLVEDASQALPSCRALDAGEGRCLPECVPEIAQQRRRLAQDSCAPSELCAPCFDPLTGEATGVCELGPDTGAKEPPHRFADCCGGHGRCAPRALLQREASEADLERLGRDACAEEESLCVPDAWLSDPGARPATCEAAGSLEGRCLSRCLPEVEEQAARLEQRSCAEHELCVPCFDPMSGEDSGACRLGSDAPAAPARRFAECCGAAGSCVPRELLSGRLADGELERLAADSCSERDALCVPRAWLEAEAPVVSSCRSTAGREGRCLPACLPDVAPRAGMLPQSSCQGGEVCAPCFDPISAEDTGACNLGSDRPAAPAQPFAACCEAHGRCVPGEALADAVSSADRMRLAADSCSERDALCVPQAWLDAASSGARVRPVACRAPGDLEGRCLPSCLPELAEQRDGLEQRSCAAHELCVPCFNPLNGGETGACNLDGDRASEPAQTFAACCGSGAEALGKCVPRRLLGDAPAERLGPDSCGGSGELCVPAAWLEDPEAKPEACRAFGELEGRCLPACLPELAAQRDALRRGSCQPQELCVPCYDPLTGADSGSCRLGRDEPLEAPRGFARCCGRGAQAAGTCVPLELLPPEQRQTLPADSCGSAASRCAPTQLLATPPRSFARCNTLASGRGVCLPGCFIDSALSGLLSTSGCGAGERCVPCSSVELDGVGCE